MGQVNFPCEHCGQLMGVLEDLLGQQVRCPHCQQVVRAPASRDAPPPSPPPPPQPEPLPAMFPPLLQPAEVESIFAPPEATDDDLFGGSQTPRLELPPEPAWTAPPVPPPPVHVEPVSAPPLPAPEPAPVPPLEPTLPYQPAAGLSAPEDHGAAEPAHELGP